MSDPPLVRVVLDEAAFASLVDGEPVRQRAYTENGIVIVELTLGRIGSSWIGPALRRTRATGGVKL